MPAAVTFSSNGPWALAAGGGLALCALLSLTGYLRSGGLRRGWPGLMLKLAGLALLFFCVMEPQWTGQRARPGANVLAVVADTSHSMNLTDSGAAESRGAQLRGALDPSGALWLSALADSFDVRRYGFDARLHSLENFGALEFDGRSSALTGALDTLAGRYRGRPFAGVLLFTDGNATDAAVPEGTLTSLPPVYPVVIGGSGPERDLALGKVSVAQSAFEDAPVTLDATVNALGCAGEPVAVRLMDKDGAVVQVQRLNAPESGKSGNVRFEVKTAGAGLSFYRLEARFEKESPAPEATLANNSRLIVTDRGQGPYRILYVSGRPNWEYKFLNRSIEADAQLQMTGLIRVARREPKFDFRGRAGETGNPLFRGFGDQTRETTGSYDQPVLVRLNTQDEVELRAGFPATPEELYKWHAIIIDDLESAFFTTAQAALLQKFVSVRGGGLLMLGGMESFAEGAYARTPIGEMLPVYLGGEAEAAAAKPPGPLRYELDREGWLQPWARLRASEEGEKARLSAMPPFEVFNRVHDVKPGASVIAAVTATDGQKAPALIVQRFGLGRTAALTVGDVWRWGMQNPEARTDMERAWRQLLRWMVADVPGRVSLSAEPVPGDVAGAIRLQARVRDAKWQPVDNATVTVEIESVITDGTPPAPLKLTAQPSATEAGLSEATFVPRAAAAFRARATAVNASGGAEGSALTGWVSDPGAAEFASLVPNRTSMEDLARRTGGRVLKLDELDSWARALPSEKAPVMETWTQPLWHTPWIFLLAIACLCGEWAWRRTHGMP
ncbi:MAG TPA: glutamine amidotransferase [Verrucomicrobiales bacterium]|nr:glutamine amidotransferase [Verrucomicrobiales bacterium]